MGGCRRSTPPVSDGRGNSHVHMRGASSASAVRLRRAWWQSRVPQPQRAAMGSVGAFKPWPSPAPDDHRIRVGGAEAPRDRPLPAPRTFVGSPRATTPPLFFAGDGCAFLRAGRASVRTRASCEGERTAQATTRRCTFTNVADEADRGRKSGSWDAEALTGASRAWEGERAERCRVRRGTEEVHAAACSSGQVRADAHAATE